MSTSFESELSSSPYTSYLYVEENVSANILENDSIIDYDSLDQSNQFVLPLWRQVFWIVLFASMVLVATGGNVIVIWIVMRNKPMRTVTNYFLVNLSLADAMVSTLNVTFSFTYMLYGHWPFGKLYCKISEFISCITICASVFTLMAISIDRFMAIVNPLKPRMGKRATICVALAIWAASSFISWPMLLFYTTLTQEYPNGEMRIICYADFPDRTEENPQSYLEYLYNVMFMILTYFLPIGAMTFTYARIGVELWGSQSIGESTQRQLDNIRNKRRVVKMMMVVVIIFAVCWLPYHLYFIVRAYFPEVNNQPYIQELYLIIYWLAMSNSMYNPLIYCWMNSRFRRGFAQFFSWCPFIQVAPDTSFSRGATSRYGIVGSPDIGAGTTVLEAVPEQRKRLLRENGFVYPCCLSWSRRDQQSPFSNIEVVETYGKSLRPEDSNSRNKNGNWAETTMVTTASRHPSCSENLDLTPFEHTNSSRRHKLSSSRQRKIDNT